MVLSEVNLIWTQPSREYRCVPEAQGLQAYAGLHQECTVISVLEKFYLNDN